MAAALSPLAQDAVKTLLHEVFDDEVERGMFLFILRTSLFGPDPLDATMNEHLPTEGALVWNCEMFRQMYHEHATFLDNEAKRICREAVFGEERGSWYVQGGVDLMNDPAGFGESLSEAITAFYATLLGRNSRPS